MRQIRFTAIYVVLCLLATITLSTACASRTPPTIARDVAVNGESLVKAVTATAQAVIDAEKQNAIPRETAMRSLEAFQRIGKSAEQVADQLDALVTLSGTEATTTVAQIQAALDLIDAGMLEALVPIGDAKVRQQVAQLASVANQIISQINRQILARR